MINYFEGVHLGARVQCGMMLGTIVGFRLAYVDGVRQRTIEYRWDDDVYTTTLFPDHIKSDEDEEEAAA